MLLLVLPMFRGPWHHGREEAQVRAAHIGRHDFEHILQVTSHVRAIRSGCCQRADTSPGLSVIAGNVPILQKAAQICALIQRIAFRRIPRVDAFYVLVALLYDGKGLL